MKTGTNGGSMIKRLVRKLGLSDPSRHVWDVGEVAHDELPAAIHRTYLEHRMIRSILGEIGQHWKYAADIGCGFGRNIAVLQEFADKVIGFEREPAFRSIAQSLHPDAVIRNYPISPPDESAFFDFAMCFTFLQHLRDSDAQNILSTAKKCTKGGYILLVEDTKGPEIPYNPKKSGDRMYKPRPVEIYESWMSPFKLINVWPRPIEATFKNLDWAGAFMLYRDQTHG